MRLRHRQGFTLMELMVTVTIIAVLLFVGATSLRTSETKETRNGAFDIVDVMRRARYVAARQNTSVVVRVLLNGTALAGGGVTRGRVDAFLGTDTSCPQTIAADAVPFAFKDFGLQTDGEQDAGIARVTPAALAGQGPTDGFCVRPNGRVLDNSTGRPVRPASATAEDLAGKAQVWVQWAPLREQGGELVVPFAEVEVPFNGLVRIPQ